MSAPPPPPPKGPPKAPPKAPPPPPGKAPGEAPAAKPKALLSGIENFKKGGLKKTQTVDKSKPLITKPKPDEGGGLAPPVAGPSSKGGKGASMPMGGLFAGGVPKLPSKNKPAAATAEDAPAAAPAAAFKPKPPAPSPAKKPAPPAAEPAPAVVAKPQPAKPQPAVPAKPAPVVVAPKAQAAPASVVASKPQPAVPTPKPAAAAGGKNQAKALYAYVAQQPDELSFPQGATINVLKKEADGWWQGELAGKTGVFPGNYVEEIVVAAAPAPKAPPRSVSPALPASKPSCEALFDYVAQQPDELTLKKGDLLVILEKMPDGWWKGQIGGRTGVFPANYVKEK